MEKQFVVSTGDSILVIPATDKDQAFHRFLEYQLSDGDSTLRDYIARFIVNDGLLETFFSDEKGHLLNEIGNYRKDLQKKYKIEKDLNTYIEQCIAKNARNYWTLTPNFAEEYLKELFTSFNSDDEYEPSFSEDFYIETSKLIINGGTWYEHFIIHELDSSSKKIQVVFAEE